MRAALLNRLLISLGSLCLGSPGSLVLDPVQDLEGVPHGVAKPGKSARKRGAELVARGLVIAVVNLVDHGDHPFLHFLRGSDRQRVSVEPVVRGAKRQFDQLEAASLVEHVPGTSRRAHGVDFRDLLDRAVFNERTISVAIRHGASPFLVVVAGEGGFEGRDFSFASDVNSLYVPAPTNANQTLGRDDKLDL